MKTSNLIPLWIAFLSSSLVGQTPDEAIHFLENENGIGVKAQSMGCSSIGAADDYTAIYWNPAALTLLSSSEINGDFYHLKFNNQANFLGNSIIDEQTFTKIKSLGLAYKFPTSRGSLVLAFGYNRFKDYDNFLNFSGYNPNSNGLEFELEDEKGEFQYYPFDQNVYQTEQIVENGNLGAYSVGGGIMVSPNFSLGVTANFYTGNGKYNFYLYQDDVDNLYTLFPADYRSYELNQYINSQFSGFGLKLGGLLQLNRELRLGFAVDLPTHLRIDEEYGSNDVLIFDDGFSSEMDLGSGEWTYLVKYPAKFSVGGALDLKQLLLSASAEYRDWTEVEFAKPLEYSMTDDYSDLLSENGQFINLFRPVLSYSMGGELRVPGSDLKLRGGYRYVPSPYLNADKSMDKQYFTAGFGYDIDRSTTIHIGYSRGFWKDYSVDSYTPGGTTEDIETDRILAGLTFRLR